MWRRWQQEAFRLGPGLLSRRASKLHSVGPECQALLRYQPDPALDECKVPRHIEACTFLTFLEQGGKYSTSIITFFFYCKWRTLGAL